MRQTRTGSFPIGFRRGWGDWQRDAAGLCRWVSDNGFAFIDTGPLEAAELKAILDSGVGIGSVDLPNPFSDMLSPDAAKRRDTVQKWIAYVRDVVAVGPNVFFTVLLPEDPTLEPIENFKYAVESYGQLCSEIESFGARIVIEGWPGPPPHFAALACTPESYRGIFQEVGSDALGVNFDPSHLIRMGIDSIRFLDEFVDRVYHVHAKDTEIFDEGLYECGNLQKAVAFTPHGYGAHHWRYTIPGRGVARWDRIIRTLEQADYKGREGRLSIELEDENYNGTQDGEQRGLIASGDFLIHL